jgi:hypothetical protein
VLPDGVSATLLMTLVFLTIPGLVLIPALLYRRPGGSPDSTDDDGGGGRGPGPPPARPPRPRGGVPLPDIDQVRLRIRGPPRARLHPWDCTCWCSSASRRS